MIFYGVPIPVPATALWALSPWYGLLEITATQTGDMIECWNGDHLAFYVEKTLLPLSLAAERFLGRKRDTETWRRKIHDWMEELIAHSPWYAL